MQAWKIHGDSNKSCSVKTRGLAFGVHVRGADWMQPAVHPSHLSPPAAQPPNPPWLGMEPLGAVPSPAPDTPGGSTCGAVGSQNARIRQSCSLSLSAAPHPQLCATQPCSPACIHPTSSRSASWPPPLPPDQTRFPLTDSLCSLDWMAATLALLPPAAAGLARAASSARAEWLGVTPRGEPLLRALAAASAIVPRPWAHVLPRGLEGPVGERDKCH